MKELSLLIYNMSSEGFEILIWVVLCLYIFISRSIMVMDGKLHLGLVKRNRSKDESLVDVEVEDIKRRLDDNGIY